MNETPPDDRAETHELHTRSAAAFADCARNAVRAAAAYGDRLLVAAWPTQTLPDAVTAVGAEVDPEATPWPDAERVVAVPVEDAPDHLDELFGDDGAAFSLLAVVRGGAPVGKSGGPSDCESDVEVGEPVPLLEVYPEPSHLAAEATVPDGAPGLADDLRAVAADHAGILTPVASLGVWHDGQRWYEVAAGSLYVMTEDPGDGDWVERRNFVSQTGHRLVGLSGIAIDRDARRIDLAWVDVDRMNAIERYFGPVVDWLAGEPPATLTFEDDETFATAANALLAGVGDDRRV